MGNQQLDQDKPGGYTAFETHQAEVLTRQQEAAQKVTFLANVTLLRTLDPTISGQKVAVGGFTSDGDGGGGQWFYDTSDTTSADNGGMVVVTAQGKRWKRIIQNGWIALEAFGAKGDGIANDVAAINNALVASAASGLLVRGRVGATYRVQSVGNKTFINGSGGTYTPPYCVEIPSGARIDWQGATLKVNIGTNAVIISNKSTSVAGDVVECSNLIVDGGGKEDTVRGTAMFVFWGIANSRCTNISLRSCSYSAGLIANATSCSFDRLDVRNIRGQGWAFGGNTLDQIKGCTFGIVTAENISSYGTFNQPGNSFLIGAAQTRFSSVIGRNCAGGHKLTSNCTDIHIDYSEFDGTVASGEVDNGSSNSGLKVQGDDSSNKATRITFNKIVSRNCFGAGLYLRNCGSVSISDYQSYNNARGLIDSDLDIASIDNLQISNIFSDSTGFSGATFSTGTVRYSIGKAIFRNVGAVGTSGTIGISPLSGDGNIEYLEVIDDRTTQRTGKAIQGSSDVRFVANNYRTNIANDLDIRVTRIVLGNPILGTGGNPSHGTWSPTAGATTTNIANANIKNYIGGQGGIVQPLIELTPMNASAAALSAGGLRYYIPSNFVATVVHSPAIGDELFAFRIVSYSWRATALSSDTTYQKTTTALALDTTSANVATKAGLTIRSNTKNLFTPWDSLDKYYMTNGGGLTRDKDHFLTGYIEVEEGATYTAWDGTGRPRFATYFDANKAVIGGTSQGPATFVVPVGVKYVRLSSLIIRKKTFQFEKNSTYTTYQAGPYKRLSRDSEITPDSLNFLTKTNNLFDKDDIVSGFYWSNGESQGVDATLCFNIKLIPVTAGLAYVGKAGGSTNGPGTMRFVVFYDANEQLIVTTPPGASILSFTAPAGAAFVRITTYVATVDNFQLEFNQGAADSNKEPFGHILTGPVTIPVSKLERRAQTPTWGLSRLRRWNAWKRNRDYRYDFVLLGDSYTDGNYFASRLFDLLLGDGQPYGGSGYLSFSNGDSALISSSIYPTKFTATWTTGDWDGTNGGGPNGTSYAPAAVDIRSLTSTATVNVTVNEALDTVTLIYQKQAGGGNFQYQINAGSWVTVSTANATTIVATEVINTSALGSAFTITIQALAVGISLGGMVARKNGNVLNVHKCGATGSQASKFGKVALFQDALNVLTPKGTMLMWGTNEQANNTNPSTMKANIQAIVNYLRAIDPLCDLIFACPTATQYNAEQPRSYQTQDYSDVMFQLAQENNGAFIDFSQVFGTFNQAQVDGLLMASDRVHPGTRGRTLLAETIFNAMTGVPKVIGTTVGTVADGASLATEIATRQIADASLSSALDTRQSAIIVPRHRRLASSIQRVRASTSTTQIPRGIALGNSIMQGTGNTVYNSNLPYRVANRLATATGVGSETSWLPSNYATGGTTTADVVPYVAFNNDAALSKVPQRGALFTGTTAPVYALLLTLRNDAAQISLADSGLLLRTTLNMLKRQNCDAILIIDPPQIDTTTGAIVDGATWEGFAAQARQIASDEGATLVDAWNHFKLKQAQGQDLRLWMSDALHPSDAGYDEIASLVVASMLAPSTQTVAPFDHDIYDGRVTAVSSYTATGQTNGFGSIPNFPATGPSARKVQMTSESVYRGYLLNNGQSDNFAAPTGAKGIILTYVDGIVGGTLRVNHRSTVLPAAAAPLTITPSGNFVRSRSIYIPINGASAPEMQLYNCIVNATVPSGSSPWILGVTWIVPEMSEYHETWPGAATTGTWSFSTIPAGSTFNLNYASLASHLNNEGAGGSGSLSFSWYGSALNFFAEVGTGHGQVNMAIDGGANSLIDLYAAGGGAGAMQSFIAGFNLTEGWHTVTFTNAGTTNTSSTGYKINIGGFRSSSYAPDPSSREMTIGVGETHYLPDFWKRAVVSKMVLGAPSIDKWLPGQTTLSLSGFAGDIAIVRLER
jgi:lysophospholipase L1-like esterase